MKRLLAFGIPLSLLLVACRAQGPLGTPAERTGVAEPARATLQVGLQWPRRETQVIPISADTIWVSVKKGSQTLHTTALKRPDAQGTQTATRSFQVDAGTGLSVRAEAFRAGQASTSIPIALAQATGVTLYANQRTIVTLDMAATGASTISSFSPTNGGPGVKVSVAGQFSPSGYYRLVLGPAESAATYKTSQLLEAPVPLGAQSGPLTVYDDGFPSVSAQSFQVLSVLTLLPAGPQHVSPGQPLAFSVPSALDTNGQQVSSPTVTGWLLLDPISFEPSAIGTLDVSGGAATFNASPTATGTAWLYVRSGSLLATTSVTVR
ncbi:hypothetical protein J7643_14370 [bacterium]|nr:hypothetical protein [bacterium]